MSEPGPSASRAIERNWERAQRYISDEQFAAAAATLEALLARLPDSVQARLLLSSVYLKLERLRDASAQLIEAAKVPVDDVAEFHKLAFCLQKLGETRTMHDCLDDPAIATSRSGELQARFAQLHQLLGQHDRALALMNHALELGFDNPDFRYYRALQLQFNGRNRDAESELEACVRMGPTHGRAWLALARMRRQSAEKNHLASIGMQLEHVERGSEHEAALEFARFKELDDLDRRDEAWGALERGNAIMSARLPHDSAAEHRRCGAMIELCGTRFLGAADGAPADDGPRPVFIVGMPRSGTTLLDRILGNHSQIASPGELPDFPNQLRWTADMYGADPGTGVVDAKLLDRLRGAFDYGLLGRRYLQQSRWRAHGRPFYVDKLPANFVLAGIIHRALPTARILAMRRDPMDVCYSNWKAYFGESYAYSYRIDTLAAHYGQYEKVMSHWRSVMPDAVLDVDYAGLVEDPEGVTARVLEFCGLPYEAGCADITRNRNPVSTLSSPQVREKIHHRALGDWRRYATQLEPLRIAIATATK
ncbi:MAG TPA: sulfotransferase [Rhodanobacteraceae bacterium]|nr:sulfotransferase [Rhodanobacteraceae bacterium]